MLEELGSSHTQTACSEEGYSNLSNLLNVVRVFIWDAVPDNYTKYLDNVDEDNYVSHCISVRKLASNVPLLGIRFFSPQI